MTQLPMPMEYRKCPNTLTNPGSHTTMVYLRFLRENIKNDADIYACYNCKKLFSWDGKTMQKHVDNPSETNPFYVEITVGNIIQTKNPTNKK